MLENTTLTPQDVANILKITKNTVYELVKRGDLNGYRVGKKIRIDLNDVEIYKNSTRNNNIHQLAGKSHEVASSTIETQTLSPNNFNSSNELIICGQDIILDILSSYLQLKLYNVKFLRSCKNSYSGLLELYMGKIQIATTHLWDGETGQYNIPYVRRLLPGIPSIILHLACTMQGFYVAKGNPKNISTWEDLKRSDITIINREKGSGTRILLDEHLRLLELSGNAIRGYDKECFSHLAVASAVARGEADLALGSEKISLQVNGIDFIPMQKERYELVMRKEDLEKPEFQAVLEIIRSDTFKRELMSLGGYDLSETGDIVCEL